MKERMIKKLLPLNCVILAAVLWIAYGISEAATKVNQLLPVNTGMTVIIDPGHGMPDGGTTSCTGILEADLNLEIASRLNDLYHLFGISTIMTRQDRDSIYTKGDTIGQKKVSDTRNRVSLVNGTDNAILLSIHQNHFFDSQYYGAQVFYANNDASIALAKKLQTDLVTILNPNSNRKAKKSTGVYLMEHIHCPAVLVECGFLSNPQEEALLRSAQYQKQLCAVVVCSTLSYMDQNNTT